MRILKQDNQKDCGLYVLQSLIQFFHNKNIDINYLKVNTNYGSDGISLLSLKSIAQNYGLAIEGYYLDFESLININLKNLPIILLINDFGQNHYVILTKITQNKIYVLDSRIGSTTKYGYDEFKQIYLGISATVKPFSFPQSDKNYFLENKLKSLLNVSKYTYPILLFAILNLLLSFVSAFFIKIVFDFILPNFLKNTLIIVFIAFTWVIFLRCINVWLKNYVTKIVSNKIYFNLTSIYFEKIEKISQNDFNKLSKIDFFKRGSFIPVISEYRANFLYSFISEILSIIFSSLLLIWINYVLFIIVFSSMIFLALVNFIYYSKVQNLQIRLINSSLNKSQADLDFISSRGNFLSKSYIENLKNILYSTTLDNKNNEIKMFRTENVNDLFNQLLINIIPNVIVFASVFLIMDSKITSGDMMMFLTSSTFFVNPLFNISKLLLSYSMIKKITDQVNFVLSFDNYKGKSSGIIIKKIQEIEIDNLNFSYEEGNDVLNIKKLHLTKNVILKGSNGSGKTTLVDLIKGDYPNFRGSIKINNIPLKQINMENYCDNILYISNKMYKPNMKIIDFITDNNKDLFNTFNYNIQKYGISELITSMKLNLNISMVDNASNLSEGQKQLINILRMFVKPYKLVILDEAFENIDTNIVNKFKSIIPRLLSDVFFIEISHNSNTIFNESEVNLDEINQNI
ncbi:Mbov_0121 family peptidase domain-containing ABC transporter [Mycoplasmopsis felifaucium]|uniref:Mbov_0121 family peptidase domain-containing ABC transporter n=1 Tax=Mycoplasmopsis felifaucium TaxID=35768 RepID=UPI000480AD17|nr:cysteine peptidase family C39 domain-containing protein [Mycoplasmopsis felifaucium]